MPVIVDSKDCFAHCRKQEKFNSIFDAIVNISTWTLPETGKALKRQHLQQSLLNKVNIFHEKCAQWKIEQINFSQVHVRGTVHDRSAPAVKKMMLNDADLTPLGTEEDLATKLGLRRSPQLFVDYWQQKGQSSSPLANPSSTSTAYYYIEGDEPMDWILIPTNTR